LTKINCYIKILKVFIIKVMIANNICIKLVLEYEQKYYSYYNLFNKKDCKTLLLEDNSLI